MPEHDLLALARRVVGRAGAGEELEVYATRSVATKVQASGGVVESFTSAASAGVGIRVVTDHRQGFAWAGTLDEAAVEEALAEARDNAGFGEPADWNGLAGPDGVAFPEVDVYREALAGFSNEARIDLALELERAVRSGDPRIKGVRNPAYADDLSERAVASTAGIEAFGRSGSCSLSVLALAEDGSGTQTGSGYVHSREPGDLDSALVGAEAVAKATRLLGAAPAVSQRLTVLLEPEVTAAFIGLVGGLASGMAVLKGRSLLAGRLGEQVASPVLTLVDDPTDPEGLGSLAHDAEGLASRRNVIIDAGRLCGFLYDGATARRAGTASTGSASRSYRTVPIPACRALGVVAGAATQAELIEGVEDGFLVQSVRGLHSGVNPVSGDFSVAAEGLRIRAGRLVEPVAGVTIASTLPRMLLDVAAVGNDRRRYGSTTAPTLVVREMSMGGT